MRYIVLLICLFVIGCASNKKKFDEDHSSPFTQRELDLLCVIEYIKYKNPQCKGDCVFNVSKRFRYFDNCLMVWDSSFFSKLGLDLDKEIDYPNQSFEISNFGRINLRRSDSKDISYEFSPFIYDPVTKTIQGQVIVRIEERNPWAPYKDAIIFNTLQNKVYFSTNYNYPIDNCYY